MTKKIAALTLGCKVNAYDTEAMLELFFARGYDIVDFGEFADVYLVNTCTVTKLSDKKSRQMLRRARKLNPDAVVVAAGCYTQVSPEEALAVEGVDLAAGTRDRLSIVEIVENYNREQGSLNTVDDIMTEREFEPLTVQRQENRTRAFIKIQEGCDCYCSYCIVPYARGHTRSRPEFEVIAEARRFVQNGYKELVLSGTHIASYGKDLGDTDLLAVLSRLHELDGLHRIRLSSVDPRIITREFVEAAARLSKVCPHFHLSLQSGCDRTLSRMNRRYTTAQYRVAAEILRELVSGVALTTDIIVGFPDETDEDFDCSYEFVKEMGFTRLHVFPFSAKDKTRAAEFENQIPLAVKRARAAKMIRLGEEMTRKFLARQRDKTLDVLYETQAEQGIYEGYSTNYITVRTLSNENLVNEIRRVRVKSISENAVKGETLR